MSVEKNNDQNSTGDDENHRESIFYDTFDDLENARLITEDVTRGKNLKDSDGNGDFYRDSDYIIMLVKTATDLMLNMTNENDRIISSKWINFITSETNPLDSKTMNIILNALIVLMNDNKLLPPLNEVPDRGMDFKELVKREDFLNIFNPRKNFQGPTKMRVTYEVKQSGAEYAASQLIPEYGIQFCYGYSSEPIIQVEGKTGVPILDKTIQFEESVHPLVGEYAKEIISQTPQAGDFVYKDIPESFIQTDKPEDHDVIDPIAMVDKQGELIPRRQILVEDLPENEYAQFAQQPLYHDRERSALKDNIITKEAERQAILEQQVRHKQEADMARPVLPIKRTIQVRDKAVQFRQQPISKPILSTGNQTSLEIDDQILASTISSSVPITKQALAPSMTLPHESDMCTFDQSNQQDSSILKSPISKNESSQVDMPQNSQQIPPVFEPIITERTPQKLEYYSGRGRMPPASKFDHYVTLKDQYKKIDAQNRQELILQQVRMRPDTSHSTQGQIVTENASEQEPVSQEAVRYDIASQRQPSYGGAILPTDGRADLRRHLFRDMGQLEREIERNMDNFQISKIKQLLKDIMENPYITLQAQIPDLDITVPPYHYGNQN